MADLIAGLAAWQRVVIILMILVAIHFAVRLVRFVTHRWISSSAARPALSKTRTLVSLLISIVVFTAYFAAFGLVLSEFGISLKAYLASASIVGLAIGFGSQGIVQDVVTGLTLIFSDLFDVGDMVEISGQTGMVYRVGMRFTVLKNPLGAEVFIPNRTINNVINYPKGYVRCLADVTLPGDSAQQQTALEVIDAIAVATHEQFTGVFRTPPDREGVYTTRSGRTFVRIKFRIWPGRGDVIEKTFKQELLGALRAIDADYADWMIAVNYEVEKKDLRI